MGRKLYRTLYDTRVRTEKNSLPRSIQAVERGASWMIRSFLPPLSEVSPERAVLICRRRGMRGYARL